MSGEERHTLSQEDIEMLQNRRALDTKFEEFMRESIEDRRGIRKEVDELRSEVAANTNMTREVHVALFATDDRNEFGITGLVTNMQTVVKHIEVVCNFAKFTKRLIIGGGSFAAAITAILALGGYFGRWG